MAFSCRFSDSQLMGILHLARLTPAGSSPLARLGDPVAGPSHQDLVYLQSQQVADVEGRPTAPWRRALQALAQPPRGLSVLLGSPRSARVDQYAPGQDGLVAHRRDELHEISFPHALEDILQPVDRALWLDAPYRTPQVAPVQGEDRLVVLLALLDLYRERYLSSLARRTAHVDAEFWPQEVLGTLEHGNTAHDLRWLVTLYSAATSSPVAKSEHEVGPALAALAADGWIGEATPRQPHRFREMLVDAALALALPAGYAAVQTSEGMERSRPLMMVRGADVLLVVEGSTLRFMDGPESARRLREVLESCVRPPAVCQHCGEPLNPAKKFCRGCGQSTADVPVLQEPDTGSLAPRPPACAAPPGVDFGSPGGLPPPPPGHPPKEVPPPPTMDFGGPPPPTPVGTAGSSLGMTPWGSAPPLPAPPPCPAPPSKDFGMPPQPMGASMSGSRSTDVLPCAVCGIGISSSDRFCAHCGATARRSEAPAGDERTCPTCGQRTSKTVQFCPNCGGRVPAERSPRSGEVPGPVSDRVHFSVTSPPAFAPGTSGVIDVWAHLEDQRQQVLKRAREAMGSEVRIQSKGPVPVARGTVLTVRLKVDDLQIDESEDTLWWEGDIGCATFPIRVPAGLSDGARAGMAGIYVGGMQVARVHFTVEILETAVARPPAAREAAVQRHRTAFASYASGDRDLVLGRIQGLQKALPGLQVFLDVASLRSGQNWEQELWKVVPSQDVFYLFWSENARRSEWVEKEWRCALVARGLDYIDPIPLASPQVVPPPQELAAKHLNDWVLAYMGTPQGRESRQGSAF